MTHPGEKRLVSLCKNHCTILPSHFEENLEALFTHLFDEQAERCIQEMVRELVDVCR